LSPDPHGSGVEHRQISRDEFLRAARDDIDPAKYAGESWFATDEYATPDGIQNPFTRAEVGREEEYYPTPRHARREGPAAPGRRR
jgi:hypothetical protein